MLKKLLLMTAKTALCGVLLVGICLQSQRLHYKYIRNHTANAVVKITNFAGTSGGTGFHVKAPSGKTYIMTNDHVCDLAVNNMLLVEQSDKLPIAKKVIERFDYTDLCLIEPIEGVSGLSVANESKSGEKIYVVGHPLLWDITLTEGEFISRYVAEVILYFIADEKELKECNKPKNRVVEVEMLFFKVPACLLTVDAYQSNIHILPGSSGSPAVNFWGNLVGVAFAGDKNIFWGSFITIDDIKKVLEK
jgi:S1-C subfamily serine protease